jgi:hypothetical protein
MLCNPGTNLLRNYSAKCWALRHFLLTAAALPRKNKTWEEPVCTRQESCTSQPVSCFQHRGRCFVPLNCSIRRSDIQSTEMALLTTTTSFSSSPTATAPVLAFPTPFPQPASCSSPVLTTTVIYDDNYGTTRSNTFHVADTSDPLYTACLAPAGGQFTFSPAVCPQGWPAWWLGKTAYASTAYCCVPSYSMPYQPNTKDLSPSCTHVSLRAASSSGTKYFPAETLSVSKLPAWHISWQPTDIPTLSPKPPAIEGDTITKWVPGSDPEREHRDNWGGGRVDGGLFFFLIIGIPLILVAGMVACVTSCCARGNRGWSRGLRATPAPATS